MKSMEQKRKEALERWKVRLSTVSPTGRRAAIAVREIGRLEKKLGTDKGN